MPTVENDGSNRRTAERLHHRRGPRAGPTGAHDQRKQAVEESCSAALLVGFHAVGFDMAGTLESLAQQRRQLTDLSLSIGGNSADTAADPDDRMDRQRKDQKSHKAEQPV